VSDRRHRGRRRLRERRRRGVHRRHHGARGTGRRALGRLGLLPAAAFAREPRRQTRVMAKALEVIGLMNVQYAIQRDTVYVLEVNPRASRTVPYVSKATGLPL